MAESVQRNMQKRIDPKDRKVAEAQKTSKSAGAPPSWALWPDGKPPVMTPPQTQTPPPQRFSAEDLDFCGDALGQCTDTGNAGILELPDMGGPRKRARAHPAEPDGTASARSSPTCCTPVTASAIPRTASFGLNVKVISGYLAARRDKA